MRFVLVMKYFFAAFGCLGMQPVWAEQGVVPQAVEPGRCGDFVAWIDLLLSPQPPNVKYRSEFLREKVPTGKCDVDAVRKAARSSKYFLYSRKSETSESFRFANAELVAQFGLYLDRREIEVQSVTIHVKKTEADFQ